MLAWQKLRLDDYISNGVANPPCYSKLDHRQDMCFFHMTSWYN
jgi:hypothetical protein